VTLANAGSALAGPSGKIQAKIRAKKTPTPTARAICAGDMTLRRFKEILSLVVSLGKMYMGASATARGYSPARAAKLTRKWLAIRLPCGRAPPGRALGAETLQLASILLETQGGGIFSESRIGRHAAMFR
jgi:hypothetical protein